MKDDISKLYRNLYLSNYNKNLFINLATNLIDEKLPRKKKIDDAKKARKIRDRLKEKEIDNMIKDSFPASDPPSTY